MSTISSRRLGLRALSATLAAGVALAGLAGCSTAASTDTGSSSSSDAAFPVTIDSALGKAVIEKKPERVVTIGWGSADTVYSLGTTPVAIEADRWAGDKDGLLPWFREAVEKNGDTLPATFDVYPEIDVDSIVEADPDLILAPQSGLTADQYDVLSQLAPTVAYPDQAWQTPYDTQIEIIGKALGKTDEAKGLVDEIDTTLADAAASHPEYADHTFAYVYAGGDPGTLSFYQKGSARVDLLSALGLKMDETVAKQPITQGTFTSVVGLENADMLKNVDLLITWFNDEAEEKATEQQPLYAQIPAVQRGSYMVSLDRQLGMAVSALTPLTVPWALDTYLPQIDEALAKVGE
ncbi:iron-siderophore ABC transporter substrate-binding protein [Okibacterium fritillariae]|uniref:iron-siderophore ABC transporter substrate-binding protein n=1 Tax=Okibacterium fritillariae TaxID=123320 RepID=UPI0040556CB8